MELRLTTARALKFEEKTGKDILMFLQDVSNTGMISLKDAVTLFSVLGDNYTIEVFDAWELPYAEKLVAIFEAVKAYVEGKK